MSKLDEETGACMKKLSRTIIVATILSLLTLSGCGTIKPVQSTNRDLSRWMVTDPNSIGLKTIKNSDGSQTYNYSADFNAEPNNTISFWKSEYYVLDTPVVKGQINGKTYPVVFDTGNSIEGTIIEDIHVFENDLPVFLFNDSQVSGSGMAMVNEFKVGTLYAENYPCVVMQNHTQIEFLGIPVSRSRHVIIPLMLMSRFKYFEFDQIEYKVRFSQDHSFQPNGQREWISFPFELVDNQILVSPKLEGIETTLLLDTGAGLDLMLSEVVTERLYQARPDLKKKWKHSAKTYGPYSEGLIKQRRVTAKNLDFGDFVVSRCKIYSGKSYENLSYQGILGFELFKKTILVLDFEKNLIWAKKAKGSRFEQ